MSTELTLPPLGDAAQAIIQSFYAQPGASVTPGQPLAIVLTERFEWDVPATAAGTIQALMAQPGATIPIGAALARLAEPDAADTARTNGRVPRATPLARKIAALHGLDLALVRGSGRGGFITQADVLAQVAPQPALTVVEPGISLGFALNHPPSVALDSRTKPVSQAPPAVQSRLPPVVHTRQSPVPVALTVVEIDLASVLAYVAAHATRLARRGVALTPIACIAYEVVAALRTHRLLNSVWSADGILVRNAVRLGVLQAIADATQTRIVADAADRSVAGLARALANADSHTNATFTLVESRTALWSEVQVADNQAAALSIAACTLRPTVVERAGQEQIEIRPLVLCTLGYDARILDPMEADAFLITLKQRLEHFSAL